MKKLVVPALMITLAAVTLGAVYLWQELRDVRTQSSELQTHIAGLQSAKLAAGTGPTMPESPAGALQSGVVAGSPEATLASAASQQPAAAAAPAAGKKTEDALVGLAQQLLSTPEGQEMMKAQLRAMLPLQYPDLGKELGLAPAETEKLFDMLVKHQLDASGIGLNALSTNGPRDATATQETRRLAQELQRTNQAELATLLGDKLPKFQDYQRTLQFRQQVTQLQAALGSGNNALSETQGKLLIAALAAEQTQIQQDRRNAPRPPQQGPSNPQAAIEQQLERAAEDTRRMVNVARSHLNPQQLDSYRQMLEQQQNLERTLIRSMSTQMGNPGN